jgi:uncharacterized protein
MTSSVLRPVARHAVVAFMVIGLAAAFLAAGVVPPIVDAQVLPFDLPLYGVVGGFLGVGVGAFLVTYALSGRAGVADLARRSVRWRVPLRWYLIALLAVPVGATLISVAIYGPDALAAPPGGWPRALAEVAAVFLLQLVLFQMAEEIGFTRGPAASLAGPVPPDETHRVRGFTVGAVAPARPLRRGRLGC